MHLDEGHTREAACLNCGANLTGEYCSTCGQRAHLHRTMGAFFHDLLHGVLHFEGTTWRTLPMLAWRPGELTRRYIDGERARFVSPLALFLFSVFLMFAVLSSVGTPVRVLPDNGQVSGQGSGSGAEAVNLSPNSLRFRVAPPSSTGWERFDKAAEKAAENPSLLLYKLQSSAYKFSWLLIPLTVPFVALLFLWRRRHWNAYEHTVFVTYSLAFQSLSFILFTSLGALGLPGWFLAPAFIIVGTAHTFVHLRGAYGLRWYSALWRTIALTFFAVVSAFIFAVLLLALGLLG